MKCCILYSCLMIIDIELIILSTTQVSKTEIKCSYIFQYKIKVKTLS